MKAYIYEKPGVAKLVDKEKPVVTESTDAIIRDVYKRQQQFVVLIYILLKGTHLKFLNIPH